MIKIYIREGVVIPFPLLNGPVVFDIFDSKRDTARIVVFSWSPVEVSVLLFLKVSESPFKLYRGTVLYVRTTEVHLNSGILFSTSVDSFWWHRHLYLLTLKYSCLPPWTRRSLPLFSFRLGFLLLTTRTLLDSTRPPHSICVYVESDLTLLHTLDAYTYTRVHMCMR